jgi:hypothetical protein
MLPALRPRTTLRIALVFACLALVLMLSACTVSSSSSTTPTPTGTPGTATPGTPTTPPDVTPAPTIPAGITDCSQVSGFSGAGAASAGAGFSDVSFPPSSVGFVSSTFTTVYQFKLIKACTKSASANDVRAYFASALPGAGWANSGTFPYSGDPTRGCGDPYCWRKSSSGVRYVSLESLSSSGSVTVYIIRLATAPTPTANITVRANGVSVANGSSGTATAGCQSGEQMLSGGYYVQDTNTLYNAEASYPSAANAWSASITNNTPQAMTLYAYVVCLNANYSLGIQIVNNSAAPFTSGTVVDTVACPGGSVVLGGGFKSTPANSGFVVGSTPGSSGWGMATRHSGGTVTETVYALCATRNVTAGPQGSAPFTVAASSDGQLSMSCAAGLWLTGGGYSNSDPSGDANNLYYLSGPASDDSRWWAEVHNRDSTSSHGARVWTVCVNPAPQF